MRKNILAAITLLAASLAAAAETKYLQATVDDVDQLTLETASGAVVKPALDRRPLESFGTQVGFGQPLIAPDKETVGWLAHYANCCTSYSIALELVLFRDGAVFQRIRGDGRAIWRWRFVGGSQLVAFVQNFTHGGAPDHYELRDISTGKLKEDYDHAVGDSREEMPAWARELHWNE